MTASPFILAIDPGSERSAFVGIDRRSGDVVCHGILANDELLEQLRSLTIVRNLGGTLGTVVAIEELKSFMQRVGYEVFTTIRWAGRFEEACHNYLGVVLLGRKEIVGHLVGTARGSDADVRAALVDRYGGAGGKAAAIGTVKAPGPLHGLAKDEWSALAVAVTHADREDRAA
jgi:hypothetical protein